MKNFYETQIVGRRTHIVAVVLGLLNLSVAFGWISPSHLVQINIVLGALGLSALRAGVSRQSAEQSLVTDVKELAKG